MKQIRRCTRIFILCFLSVSVFVPIFLLTNVLKNFDSRASEGFIGDLSSIKYRTDTIKLHAVEKEGGESLKEPPQVVYKDGDFSSVVDQGSSDGTITSVQSKNAKSSMDMERNGGSQGMKQDSQPTQWEQPSLTFGQEGLSKQMTLQYNHKLQSQSRMLLDVKLKEARDQLIRAKVYLRFALMASNSQLVKELKLRIKELERAVGDSRKDSDLSHSASKRMKAMEATLSKASRVYSDCPAMAKKLRAMTYNAEEQVRAQSRESKFLVQLTGRTTPKSHHCLSMRLTAEFFALQPKERQFPNQQRLHDPDLYHFAVFSDNVLACGVVVSSTVSTSREPEKIVFHVVTDSLNLPAMSLWFLSNPPGNATIQIQSIDNFKWLTTMYGAALRKNSHDPRYTSVLNHLRFYLPDIYPMLNKIVLLDHDVVVQRDLTELWSINMNGKVNGAVETCQVGEPSFRRMDMFVNFSDPMVARTFDRKACTWAFGMNVFDLQEWRRKHLTRVYHKYLQLGYKRPLWMAGSLPLGWVTFYNHTVGLDRTWHVLGLGYESGAKETDIEQAAVIHFDGVLKPWLDIGLEKYKDYWRRHVNYDHSYLQQCNIQR